MNPNKKNTLVSGLAAAGVLATLLPPYANAALIELTATGTIVGGQSYYWNGTQNVAVADGTPLSVTFLLDSATFGPAVVGYNGETLFGAPGGFASCPGVQLPQDPLFPGGITSVVDLQGVTLDNQTAGNVRDCDSVLMWQGPELHVLTVLQDAYNTTRTYYTDGDLATVSPTPTSYYVDETRINLVSINGTLSNSPFSEDEMLDELAQGMTISPYGMTLSAQMFQSFYVCSSSGCGNDASGGAFQRYELAATVTGLSGTIVPVPASLGLLLTGLAAVGLRARQRQPANAR